MTDAIVREELTLLDRVRERLDDPMPVGDSGEASLVKELTRLRELLVEGSESKDAGAIHQQYEQGTALLRQLREGRSGPSVERDSPYFAHLRLREDGAERDLCLGRATFIERGVRIVDWRNAPISKLYYRYGQGDDYEEEVAGRMRVGEVVARRAVTIRHGRLERVEAPEGTFVARRGDGGWQHVPRESARLGGGEGAALRAHAVGQAAGRRLGTDLEGSRRRADKRLPELAGLLDPAQFGLITRPSSGFLVIRGAAGSGKTTVALHRIAYLAYDDASVDSDRTLFIVLSRGLRSYVSHVLPALGVTRVRARTFEEWAAEHRALLFPRLPRETRYDTPSVVQRLKLHPVLLAALADQVRRVEGPKTAAQVLDDWASVLCRADALAPLIERSAPGTLRDEELTAAAAWSRARHEELTAFLDGDSSAPAALDAEDDALLLRAWQLRVGPLPGRGGRPLRYRHVAIDEVQDLSPVEVRVLIDCLDERRSLTLAGDTQQHVMQEAGFSSWTEFLGHVGLPGTSLETLSVSYRSSREIVAFAHGLLGPLREEAEPPITTRRGPPVECFEFTDAGACVAHLAEALHALASEEPLASVAVLTPSPEASALYFRGLTESEVPRLRRVTEQDFTFSPGVEVTEVPQAKGLEFDYVVLVEVNEEAYADTHAARRLLHVGATRAVHQLWVMSTGRPSRLLAAATAAR
ncbi:MAG: ATP-binding domain-containing protein [Deltaproteobacteria bacterium]|nr:ATP-binding domain-containing protein [Deltaproteobacteria bacterium]